VGKIQSEAEPGMCLFVCRHLCPLRWES
jgi:hypothetical protein